MTNVQDKKRIQVQLDSQVANQAEAIFDQLGLTPTAAINAYYKKVIASNGIPFNLTLSTDYEQAQQTIQDHFNSLPENKISTSQELSAFFDED